MDSEKDSLFGLWRAVQNDDPAPEWAWRGAANALRPGGDPRGEWAGFCTEQDVAYAFLRSVREDLRHAVDRLHEASTSPAPEPALWRATLARRLEELQNIW